MIIAITGGIGSGKSVVSRVLRVLGYRVFDCDSEARIIMNDDNSIKRRITACFGGDIVIDGTIDRRRLGEIVFNDSIKLRQLNEIVHGAVKCRIADWCKEITGIAFIETAILYQSGLNVMVDGEWRVEAPVEVRVERVKARNGLNRAEVEARIAAQNFQPCDPRPELSVITNDDIHAVLPQITELLDRVVLR